MNETVSFCLFAAPTLIFGVALAQFVRRFKKSWQRREWLRLLVANLLVFFFLGSAAFFLGESYYRFIHDTTDAFNYTKTSQRWFKRYYHLNAANGNLRDNITYKHKIEPGKRRITFLGDSFTAGHGVKNVDDRFANLVRKTHPEWEVHVLAELGFDTGVELSGVLDLQASAYQFDEVVLVYCLNDISDMMPEWQAISQRIYSDSQRETWLVQNSYFANTLHYRLLARRESNVGNYYHSLLDAYRGNYWEQQKARLMSMREHVAKAGGRLSVVIFPFLHALGPNYEYRFVHEQLEKFWTEQRVSHVDLLTMFEPFPPSDLVVNSLDPHPNELAHELAAKVIGEFLITKMRREALLLPAK
jgi:lysophospholipase L1-like esterase